MRAERRAAHAAVGVERRAFGAVAGSAWCEGPAWRAGAAAHSGLLALGSVASEQQRRLRELEQAEAALATEAHELGLDATQVCVL